MKKMRKFVNLAFVTSIFALLMIGQTMAKSDKSVQVVSETPTKVTMNAVLGTAESITGEFRVENTGSFSDKARLFIGSKQSDFKMVNPSAELETIFEKTDDLGLTHVRMQQKFNGLDVWGCQTIVHFRGDNTIYAVGGQTIPTPTFSVSPSIEAAYSQQTAISSLKGELAGINVESENNLIVYPNNGDPRLAYMHVITSPVNGAIKWRVFIDAQTGELLHKFNDIHFDGPDVGTGPDTRDSMRTFNIYLSGTDYLMQDVTHNAQITTYQDYYGGGPISTDPDGDKVWDDATTMKAEVAGHYYTQLTYEYFLNTFGRDSYDDAGGSILVNVHDPVYTNNAYWNGQGINFADGDGVNWLPFSGSLDVVAHELTHGVTQHSAGLIYQFQSGALNESFSDVFGTNVDRDDWLLGEEISISGTSYIRSMANPNSTGQPAHMDEYQNRTIDSDNGGVHVNSGIPNNAYYMTCLQIGRDDAEQIWYRCLTTYMTPSSGFYLWAGMTIQSAIDLYGADSPQQDAVETALSFVGLGTTYVQPDQITTGALIGQTAYDTLWIYNPGTTNGSQTVTVIPPTLPGLTVSEGPYFQAAIPDGDSSQYILEFDGTSLGECNVGSFSDSLRFDVTSSLGTMFIKLPMTITVGYSARNELSSSISSSCLYSSFSNTTNMSQFQISGNDVMYQSSFMVGLSDGGASTVYRDLFGTDKWSPVDVIDYFTNPNIRSFKISSIDARIQGDATYSIDTLNSSNCKFVIVDYKLYNLCDTALSVYAGIMTDFDVDASGSNIGDYDASRNMVYIRNSGDTRAAGVALLSGTAHNLRALSNPIYVWSGAFTDATAYNQMVISGNAGGPFADDYSALITFGNPTLAPGDTVEYKAAYLYSDISSTDLAAVYDSAYAYANYIAFTCGDANGDDTVNILDITFMISYLYGGGPAPDPLESADANNDGAENILDITYLIAFLYNGGPAPDCP